MLNVFYKIMLIFNATSWMLIVYIIKSHIIIGKIEDYMLAIICIAAEIIFAFVSLKMDRWLDKDELEDCAELNLADNEFLPVYLGYFFVALSIPDWYTMLLLHALVFIFTALMNSYFNPSFILFGYHYYHVKTVNGTSILLICNTSERNPKAVRTLNLRRINNMTYISCGGK